MYISSYRICWFSSTTDGTLTKTKQLTRRKILHSASAGMFYFIKIFSKSLKRNSKNFLIIMWNIQINGYSFFNKDK